MIETSVMQELNSTIKIDYLTPFLFCLYFFQATSAAVFYLACGTNFEIRDNIQEPETVTREFDIFSVFE